MRKYSLISLDHELKTAGLTQSCIKYALSGDSLCLHIVYLDYSLAEQYISVFRTSRLCYRIYYNGVMTSKRTCREAFNFLAAVLTEVIAKNEYYKTITVAELGNLSGMSYTDRLNLFRRNELRLKSENA